MSNEFFINLKQDYPRTWAEFCIVAEDVLKSSSATNFLDPEELPFDLMFGIILKFFKENELEFDYNNLSRAEYTSEIRNIFSAFESVIGHYS